MSLFVYPLESLLISVDFDEMGYDGNPSNSSGWIPINCSEPVAYEEGATHVTFLVASFN